MASPHVAGVAALIASEFGPMSPGAMLGMLTSTADPMACPPDPSIYDPFPAFDNRGAAGLHGGPDVQRVQRPRPGGRAQRDHLIQRTAEDSARGPVRTDRPSSR